MVREQKKIMQPNTTRLAAVRVRGITQIHSDIAKTMTQLRLYRKNYCYVFPNNTTYEGMIRKAKDYITWGEIDDETYNLLVQKKGEEFKGDEQDAKGLIPSNDFVTINGKKLKKFFRLNPPKGGFEKKGIKHTFTNGGALGYRGADINRLIKRML